MASMKLEKAIINTSCEDEAEFMKAQMGARVIVHNVTLTMMTLNRSFSWVGVPGGLFPASIGANSSISFDHLSQGGFGSKGMVVYDAANASGQMCSWVLAWDAPANIEMSPNKVYVITGFKVDIDALPNDQIQARLDNSIYRSLYSNPSSKTDSDANINTSNQSVATVGATFALLP